MTTDLQTLSWQELKQLSKKVTEELDAREREERVALQHKLRSLVSEAGFDPEEVSFGAERKTKRARKSKKSLPSDGDEECVE